jgi:hypothetical protein
MREKCSGDKQQLKLLVEMMPMMGEVTFQRILERGSRSRMNCLR